MPLIDDTSDFGTRVRERVNSERIIWLVTQGRNGTPQPSPVWFLPVADEEVVIYSQPDTPKLRNIVANPTVALAFNFDARGSNVAIFHGEASVDETIPPTNELPGYTEKYREGIEALEMTPESFAASYSVPIRVRLTRLRGW